VPQPGKLGPWLRDGLGADGGLLAARALVRLQIVMFRPMHAHAVLTPLDEREARYRATEEHAAPAHGAQNHGVAPPMALLHGGPVRAPQAPGARNVPSLLLGVLLLALALQGWNTASLCLWRLPR
jgi:hypothetical protein